MRKNKALSMDEVDAFTLDLYREIIYALYAEHKLSDSDLANFMDIMAVRPNETLYNNMVLHFRVCANAGGRIDSAKFLADEKVNMWTDRDSVFYDIIRIKNKDRAWKSKTIKAEAPAEEDIDMVIDYLLDTVKSRISNDRTCMRPLAYLIYLIENSGYGRGYIDSLLEKVDGIIRNDESAGWQAYAISDMVNFDKQDEYITSDFIASIIVTKYIGAATDKFRNGAK